MKSTKILLTALSLAMMLLPGCKKDVVTGIDTSKAGVKDFTFDEDASGKTSIAFYWNDDEAIKAGATSFSVQLAQKADFTDIDMYDSKIGKTISATSTKHDAVVMEGLTESTRYYARIRANYPRSIYSDWTQLTVNGNVICVAVGHGVVMMEFVAPTNLTAAAKKYNKFVADWGIVAPADGYAPEYKKASDASWTTVDPVTEPTFTVSDAAEGTEYNVRVRSFRTNDGGNVEYSDYVETTVSTPSRKLHDINTAAELKEFFKTSATAATNSDIYTLKADIDLGADSLCCASSFVGEFYGDGHTISNGRVTQGLISSLESTFTNVKFKSMTFVAPAIEEITSDGDATNVVFDSSCSFAFKEPAESANLGILCGKNEGTIKNCSSAVKVDQTVNTLTGECHLGGLIGQSEGYVEGCSTTGSFVITVSAPTKSTFHWIGGVIGQASGKAGKTIVKDCTNEGPVSLTFQSSCYFTLGGVVGGTPMIAGASEDHGVFDGLINKGAVTDYYIEGGSGAYPNVGGCIGYAEGYIQNCENSGFITLKTGETTSTWTNSHVGGVAGAVTRGAKKCTNKGGLSANIIIAGGTAGNRGAGCTSSSCYAGVIGAAGPYNGASSDIVFEDLTNEANIDLTQKSITETPNSYYGGVLGYVAGSVKNCTNKGSVSVDVPTTVNRLGGVVGGCSYDLIGCTNSGAVTFSCDLIVATITTWRFFVAGVCGQYDASKCTVKTNANSGNITLNAKAVTASTRDSGIAGVIGNDLSSGCTFAEDNTNTGTITATSTSNVIKAEIIAQGLN